jgi:chromate transporter
VNQSPTTWRLFVAFARLGATAFGGPAMLAKIRELCVEQTGWLSPADFDEGVALCQVVPGATAAQCAAYVGLRGSGLRGAVSATVGFCLPAFGLMLLASVSYAHVANWVRGQAILQGLRAVVVAIVVSSAIDLARHQLRSWRDWSVTALAGALMLTGLHPMLVVAAAAIAGLFLLRSGRPSAMSPVPLPVAGLAKQLGTLLALLAGVLLLLLKISPVLGSLTLVMMKVSLFAFGGGFAALPLMLHECVTVHGWLPASGFLDGVALAQVSPGPVSIVATFVGYCVGGFPAATLATLAVFLPSLVVVVALAPWFGRLQRYIPFRAATRGAAVSLAGLLFAVSIQLGQAVSWTFLHAVLAGVGLIASQLKVNVLWIVAIGGMVAGSLP